MEPFRNSRVTVVDDDQVVCKNLTEIIQSWGLCVECFTQTEAALVSIRKNKCDIILLDVYISDVCGLDLIPQIGNDKKIIILTRSSDKNKAIRALKLGAFDLLEKPLHSELLYHSILRALTALAKERESERLINDLKQTRSELLAQQQRMESLNAVLLETNSALSIFAQNIEKQREEVKRQIALEVRNLIMPMVVRLRNDKELHKYQSQLDILIKQIEELTSGFTMDLRLAKALSFTEVQIASLIKNGIRSEEIARQLHIAESTVRTHRKNIRKKLKINDAQLSLRNFLNSRTLPRRLDQFGQQAY